MAYTHVPKQKRRKWDQKSKKGLFIGYDESIKGYRVYFENEHQISPHRNVIFREDNENSKEISLERSEEDTPIKEEFSNDYGDDPNLEHRKEEHMPETDKEEHVPETGEEKEEEAHGNTPAVGENNDQIRKLCDRSKIKPPVRYTANHVAVAMTADIDQTMENEPTTYEDAIHSKNNQEWKDAMNAEMESLKKHHVWKMCDLPAGKEPLNCKWVYRIKCDNRGKIQKYKARLVTCGYGQRYGIDYQETFSPVAKFDSIRLILSCAAMDNMKLQQFDVTTAFLYANLEEDVYMKQPKNRVCKLEKIGRAHV